MPSKHPHPGELVRDAISDRGWTVAEAARQLRIGRGNLSRFLNGHAGPSMRLTYELQRVFGGSARSWMIAYVHHRYDHDEPQRRPR